MAYLAIFVGLRHTLDPQPANLVALAVTAVANTAVRTFAAHPELKAAVQAMGGPP